ncbi:probable 18S rRNA (guanine-N(7))-methyltransferase [Oppia nitens]|uniref:probable 18S rRNA (guanine-N(7))-methyltransferase n=1 Tax=Oppia nitens TaxID=1686743 RepID=UPI0023DBD246|nr:probable 18S rRNA (guanine-N(7))-methyltransferase [Oppia nitens]
MASSGRRPEHTAPPEMFYNESEAIKYTSNSRMIAIQAQMSGRALELLALPDADDYPRLILDLGCGSGLSGQVVEEMGHMWIGLDISEAMLNVCRSRELQSGDTLLADLGEGLPLRAGLFDGAISISCIQWLCNADKSTHSPVQRLYRFFSTLYSCLARNTRAVFQFYPENTSQIELITAQAMKAGFTGGLVVDYPNSTKAKKMFLVLFTGGSANQLPKGLSDGNDSTVDYNANRQTYRSSKPSKAPKKSRQWVLDKKERHRRQGKNVRPDSKYTARKRSSRF